MELEELKNAWLALGEKLDQKEKLSDIIIRDMYQTKVKKSVNVLVGYEILTVVVCLLVLPLIAWLISTHTSMLYICGISYWAIFALGAAFWSFKKATLLMKLDEVGNMKDNIKTINTYAVWINKEKLYYLFTIVIGVIPIFIIYWLYAKPWLWVFLIAILVLGALVTIWGYKRLYDRNIRTIQQNLNELKDLED